MGTKEHKQNAPRQVKVGVISVSSTRTVADDESGHWIRKRIVKEGHQALFHQVIADDGEAIREFVLSGIQELRPQVILVTGGTGISAKDVTIEALQPLFEKELTAFGSIFAGLSFEQIDSAAILSRATAGIIDRTVIFCIPGSLKACKLACNALILPELGHLVKHIDEA